jgi:hypothetical protein
VGNFSSLLAFFLEIIILYFYITIYFPRMSSNTSNVWNLIDQIHPLNAQYLLQSEPHRLYGDNWWNKLEFIVERFANNVFEVLYDHGGIIAVGYHDAATDGKASFENAFVLSPSWNIQALHPHYWVIPVGITRELFYMLLNPVEMDNWILLDKKEVELESIQLWRDIGINLVWGPWWLKESAAIMKQHYIRRMK